MSVTLNSRLPEATLLKIVDGEPTSVQLSSLTKGRKVVLFAVPGAYTGVCTTAHVPSFVSYHAQLMAKGIEDIICVSVNDPFVLQEWGNVTGANKAGIVTLADPEAQFTTGIGMAFSAPPVGLINRSQRYAMVVDDGVVTLLNIEGSPGECSLTAASKVLEQL